MICWKVVDINQVKQILIQIELAVLYIIKKLYIMSHLETLLKHSLHIFQLPIWL